MDGALSARSAGRPGAVQIHPPSGLEVSFPRCSGRLAHVSRTRPSGDDMSPIDETPLPGIGIRRDFATLTGARIGVITYRDGQRELLVFDERDGDECRASITLSQQDSRTLADPIGGSQISEHLAHE